MSISYSSSSSYLLAVGMTKNGGGTAQSKETTMAEKMNITIIVAAKKE